MRCATKGELCPGAARCSHYHPEANLCYAAKEFYCVHKEEVPHQDEVMDAVVVVFPDASVRFYPADLGTVGLDKVLQQWRDANEDLRDYPCSSVVGRLKMLKRSYEGLISTILDETVQKV